MAVGSARPGTAKAYVQGTHRVRRPEETWEIIRPRLSDFGITRISDVTGLDTLGIPVAMAARPLSWTLCVSQGKGQTLTLAKVSAAMECIELWHAEHTPLPLAHTDTPADALGLPYRISELGVVQGPFLSDRAPLDWVNAVGMISGKPVPVPRDAVFFPDPRTQHWSPASLRANSNGLASGNVWEEAALHALYEIIERDVLCRPSLSDVAAAPAVDPRSIPDEVCAGLTRSVLAAGGRIAIQHLPNAFGIPTYRAVIWSWEFAMPCAGYGSHSDPLVAVSRAVTEAAQGRLAAIVGSRDDLEDYYGYLERPRAKAEYLSHFPAPEVTFAAQTPAPAAKFEDVSRELSWLAGVVCDVVGQEPLLVDLTTCPDLAVVKVVVPGAAFLGNRVHAKLERPV
ncbi:YcaO-like family protein [Rhizomonospora bruguierae]|uniref:YcaO-like family protein n=1 Tax=Rhizomonospora bruguierae TaxID=1581705 RepID=UPI001BCD0DE9|nr:YcaO-like family protein [Micromonospora sp. NBRC 107566]